MAADLGSPTNGHVDPAHERDPDVEQGEARVLVVQALGHGVPHGVHDAGAQDDEEYDDVHARVRATRRERFVFGTGASLGVGRIWNICGPRIAQRATR